MCSIYTFPLESNQEKELEESTRTIGIIKVEIMINFCDKLNPIDSIGLIEKSITELSVRW